MLWKKLKRQFDTVEISHQSIQVILLQKRPLFHFKGDRFTE